MYVRMYDGLPPPPPSPPPTPWYTPLPVKWVVVLFGLVDFPVWSCLASSPPPPPSCGVGPVVFLVGPAPPVGGNVFYRGSKEVWYGCCRLLVVLSVPSPPPVGWGLWPFWLAPPRLCRAVCSAEMWYGCCRLLAVMSSLRARYDNDVALFSWQTVPLSLL